MLTFEEKTNVLNRFCCERGFELAFRYEFPEAVNPGEVVEWVIYTDNYTHGFSVTMGAFDVVGFMLIREPKTDRPGVVSPWKEQVPESEVTFGVLEEDGSFQVHKDTRESLPYEVRKIRICADGSALVVLRARFETFELAQAYFDIRRSNLKYNVTF